jgi:disease resistance protein RPM1
MLFFFLDRYKVDAIRPAKTLVDPRITALYTKATDLVGIDEAREELITRLTKGDGMSAQQQRVVSIVGFGGLGKTTLAKAVFDQLRVQFDCTAFVSVSQNPDLNKLLKNMLYELDKQKHANIHSTMLEERHLIDLIREFLQNKRYGASSLSIYIWYYFAVVYLSIRLHVHRFDVAFMRIKSAQQNLI